jgi:hypothetical protein
MANLFVPFARNVDGLFYTNCSSEKDWKSILKFVRVKTRINYSCSLVYHPVGSGCTVLVSCAVNNRIVYCRSHVPCG